MKATRIDPIVRTMAAQNGQTRTRMMRPGGALPPEQS
jgi:hypothetical protein